MHPLINLRSRWLSSCGICALLLAAHGVVAQAERDSYDVDGDGLLEIRSIEDFLAIQSSFGSAKLYGESSGCPTSGCIGYELVADLDFAAVPESQTLTSPYLYGLVFEGNNHVIQNLTARFNGEGGLFHTIENSVVRNLVLENVAFSQTDYYLGAIAAISLKSSLVNVRVTGNLRGSHYTGGLLGVAHETAILDCHFSGAIEPTFVGASLGKGGLVGNGENVMVYASSAEGRFALQSVPQVNHELGGIIGTTHSSNTIVASYAHFENIAVNLIGNIAGTAIGVTVESSYSIVDPTDNPNSQAVSVQFYSRSDLQADAISHIDSVSPVALQCPQSEWDSRCEHAGLFHNWQLHKDSVGQMVWDFGSSTDFPRIRDGLISDLQDSDGDGILDVLDRFPLQAAASEDFDKDGQPDRWHADCDAQCQASSGLQLDANIKYPVRVEVEERPSAGGFSFIELLFGCAVLGAITHLRRRSNLPAVGSQPNAIPAVTTGVLIKLVRHSQNSLFTWVRNLSIILSSLDFGHK